jgi:tripartite-type tricarboxylate transporter receptor subunit TctC
MPNVPSWQEEGVNDADVVNYWGIVAPAGTSPDIVARLNGEVRKVLAQPDTRTRLEREGVEIVAGAPERLGAMIEADLHGWKKLIADFGLRFE